MYIVFKNIYCYLGTTNQFSTFFHLVSMVTEEKTQIFYENLCFLPKVGLSRSNYYRSEIMNYIISSLLILFINMGYDHLLLTRKRSIKGVVFIFVINELIMLFGGFLSDIFLKETVFYKYAIFILLCTLIIYIYFVFEESISIKIFTMFTVWLFSNIPYLN